MSAAKKHTDSTIVLKVPEMRCAHCVDTVMTALSRVEGVRRVNVKLRRKQVRVLTDVDQNLTAATLITVLEPTGYRAQEA